MIRPCSGLDCKKSWQGGDNDEEHAHVPQAHYGIAVLAGLRQQAAIAKCKAWTDPIHTKSVREKWPAKLASTPTAESSG